MPFVSTHERTLDEKNRLQIPSEFRSRMEAGTEGEWFYLCPGEYENTLSLYPNKTWDALVGTMRTREMPGEAAIRFERWFYAKCCPLEMDAQGRVVLPKGHLEELNLGKEITLSGAGRCIDIWNSGEFHEFMKAGRQEWPEMKKYLRMVGSGWKDPNLSSSA